MKRLVVACVALVGMSSSMAIAEVPVKIGTEGIPVVISSTGVPVVMSPHDAQNLILSEQIKTNIKLMEIVSELRKMAAENHH